MKKKVLGILSNFGFQMALIITASVICLYALEYVL